MRKIAGLLVVLFLFSFIALAAQAVPKVEKNIVVKKSPFDYDLIVTVTAADNQVAKYLPVRIFIEDKSYKLCLEDHYGNAFVQVVSVSGDTSGLTSSNNIMFIPGKAIKTINVKIGWKGKVKTGMEKMVAPQVPMDAVVDGQITSLPYSLDGVTGYTSAADKMLQMKKEISPKVD